MDRYSRPICKLSQCATNGASLLTTITFLGERQVVIDPQAAILVVGQTAQTVNGNRPIWRTS